jgi:O-antigen ligase
MNSRHRRTAYRQAPSNSDMTRDMLTTPAGLVFCAALVASVFQIYTVAVGGFYVPLSLALSMLCLLYIAPSSIDRRVMLMALLYMATLLVSIAWSPSFSAWANGVVYQSLFFIGLFSFQSMKNNDARRSAIRLFLLAASANAIVTVIFRIIPALKMAYLSTSVRALFINPNTVESVLGKNINVTDVSKSGGFLFINGNTGAAFNMMCLGMSICLMQGSNKRGPLLLATIFLSSIVASGSKSALLVSVAVIVIAAALYFLRTNRFLPLLVVGAIVVSIALVLFSSGIFDKVAAGKFSQDTAQTSSYRVGLLQVAGILFRQNPILGLGFGGWERKLPSYADFYGLSPEWPPHNSIVMAWAQAGLLSALVLIALFGYILTALIKSYQKTSGSFRPGGALIAFLCVTAMSLGDPYPLFGNSSMAFPLGCVVAFGLRQRAMVKQAVERRTSRA